MDKDNHRQNLSSLIIPFVNEENYK